MSDNAGRVTAGDGRSPVQPGPAIGKGRRQRRPTGAPPPLPHQRRPGHPKKLSDAELVCLAVAQVLLGARSEHHWLRMC